MQKFKKVALITGCSGLIGSQSVSFFINKGYKVIGVDNHMREYFFGSSVKKNLNFNSNQTNEFG
jgi:CDP-paratose 2-epimerase